MKAFDYSRPTTVEEACRIARESDETAKVLAGGTDLLIRMKNRFLAPTKLISLRDVGGLSAIQFNPEEGLTIDSMVSMSAMEDSADIQNHYPAIAESAATVGSVQIRNRATIGGNICNAAPSADLLPILIAYGATVVLTDGETERSVALEDFFTGPGITILKKGELLKSIKVPVPSPTAFAKYIKSCRSAIDLAIVGVGIVADFDEKKTQCRQLRLVLGAVGPTPIRVKEAEELVAGRQLDRDIIQKIGDVAMDAASPITDIRATASYRRTLVSVNSRRALIAARTWAQKGVDQ